MPPPPRTTLVIGLLWGLLCGLLGSCAVLPDWSYKETREVSVLVDYEVDGDDDFVVLPASNDWLTVLELHTRPGVMRESFLGKERRVHVPPHTRSLQVLCRYKLYSHSDRAGHRLPWPTAAELFPGATRIRHTTTADEDFLEEQEH